MRAIQCDRCKSFAPVTDRSRLVEGWIALEYKAVDDTFRAICPECGKEYERFLNGAPLAAE